MILKKLVASLFIGCLIAIFTSCASYVVGIHTLETQKNHFVIVSSLGTVYDCYSIVDGQWKPVCKEVERKSTYRWSNQSYSGGE